MAVNSTKTVQAVKETAIKDLEKQVKEAAARLSSEKLVKVSIPKALERYLGPTHLIGLNGAMIVLPVDGKEYEIPAPMKPILMECLDNLQA